MEVRNWLFVGLNQLGKVGVSVGISIIYFWSAELYPTIIRNSLFGLNSMVGRVGAIIAPFIADLVRTQPYTGYLVIWLHILFSVTESML